jgi:hypothetical protein
LEPVDGLGGRINRGGNNDFFHGLRLATFLVAKGKQKICQC